MLRQNWVWVFCALIVHCLLPTAKSQISSIPLEIISSSPSEVSNGETFQVEGRQAITVIFSRSVIALGQDFGVENLPDNLVPFVISPLVPGDFRWITTYIARFDPAIDWPTDQTYTVTFNEELTAYDGATLGEATPPPAKLTTQSLSLFLQSVSSETADELTDGRWSPFLGLSNKAGPEVPPDGVIVIRSGGQNQQFDLSLLLTALQVEVSDGADGFVKTGIEVNVEECAVQGLPIPVFSVPTLPPDDLPDPTGLNLNETSCAQVTLPLGALNANTQYRLVLPKGSDYGKFSGNLKQAIELPFQGLLPFAFPFLDDESLKSVEYQRLHLLLLHGLKDGEDSLPALQSAISIKSSSAPAAPSLPIALSLKEPAVLRLEAPLQPGQTYTLEVAASSLVKDGFGLNLQAGKVTFTMEKAEGFFVSPRGPSLYISPEPSILPALTRGPQLVEDNESGSEWYLWSAPSVDSPLFVEYLTYVANFGNSNQQGNLTEILGEPDVVFKHNPAILVATILESDASDLTAQNGMVVWQDCCRLDRFNNQNNFYRPGRPKSLTVSNLAVSVVVGSAPNLGNIVWVTNSEDGGPVEGARVDVWIRYFQNSGGSQIEKLDASGEVTGIDGVVEINLASAKEQLGITNSFSSPSPSEIIYVVSTPDGKQVMTTAPAPGFNTFTTQNENIEFRGRVYLDRKLVKPGEQVFVTGYLYWNDGGLFQPYTGQGATLSIFPDYNDPGSAGPVIQLETDDVYGSVHTSFTVPEDAQFQTYQISLEAQFQGGARFISQDSITVGDPRPPTAELSVTTPDFVKPEGPLVIQVQARSFIGADVEGAVIDVTWNSQNRRFIPLDSSFGDGAGINVEGEAQITTGEDGTGSLEIDISEFSQFLEPFSDSINIELIWVGPTRERIFETVTVPVARSSVQLSLSPLVTSAAPGVGGGVEVDVTSVGEEGDAIYDNIKVSLYPFTPAILDAWTDACELPTSSKQTSRFAPPSEREGWFNACYNFVPPPFTAQNTICTLTALNIQQSVVECRVVLPTPDEYAVSACATLPGSSNGDDTSCVTYRIGKSIDEWELFPLQGLVSSYRIAQAEEQYTVGDTITLYVENPVNADGQLMVVSGCSDVPLNVQILEALPGLTQAEVQWIENCDKGISVVTQLVVPRRAEGTTLAVSDFPISAIYDPDQAIILEGSMTFNPASSDAVLDVVLNVLSDAPSGDDGVVVAPGDEAVIRVIMEECGDSEDSTTCGPLSASAQVTLIAVDKALLALIPNPLPDFQSLLQTFEGDNLFLSVYNIYERLRQLAPGLLARLALASVARIDLDPFIPPVLNVAQQLESTFGGKHPLDYTDEEFVALFATAITQLPGGRFNPVDSDDYYSYQGSYNYYQSDYIRDNDYSDAQGGGYDYRFSYDGSFGFARSAQPLESAARGAESDAAPAAQPGAPGVPAGPPSTPSGTSSPDDIVTRLEDLFLTTPLFEVVTTKADDSATATFDAPPNLGTFVLRAIAVTPAGVFGTGETDIIVRRPVSITAALPRFARIGDEFAAGVLVTVQGACVPSCPAFNVQVSLDGQAISFAEGGVGLSRSQSISLDDGETQEVRFPFKAVALGDVDLTFTVSGGGSGGDSVQLSLSVLGTSLPATLATSFAIQATDAGAENEEGLQLPQAIPGSSSLVIQAGVGRLPAVLQISSQYYKLNETRYVYGYDTIARASILPVIAAYLPLPIVSGSAEAFGQCAVYAASLNSLTSQPTPLNDVDIARSGVPSTPAPPPPQPTTTTPATGGVDTSQPPLTVGVSPPVDTTATIPSEAPDAMAPVTDEAPPPVVDDDTDDPLTIEPPSVPSPPNLPFKLPASLSDVKGGGVFSIREVGVKSNASVVFPNITQKFEELRNGGKIGIGAQPIQRNIGSNVGIGSGDNLSGTDTDSDGAKSGKIPAPAIQAPRNFFQQSSLGNSQLPVSLPNGNGVSGFGLSWNGRGNGAGRKLFQTLSMQPFEAMSPIVEETQALEALPAGDAAIVGPGQYDPMPYIQAGRANPYVGEYIDYGYEGGDLVDQGTGAGTANLVYPDVLPPGDIGKAIVTYLFALRDLQVGRLTSFREEIGLQYIFPDTFPANQADVDLNLFGAFAVKEVSRLPANNPSFATLTDTCPDLLASLAQIWQEAGIREFVRQTYISRFNVEKFSPGQVFSFVNRDAHSLVLLLEGQGWKPDIVGAICGTTSPQDCPGYNATIVELTSKDLSLQAIRSDIADASVETQAKFALSCLRSQTPGCVGTDVTAALEKWQDDYRIQGRSAYIASGTGQQSPAGISANSFALLAILESSADFPLPNLLANYVAGSLNSAAPRGSYGPQTATMALIALASYDEATQSTNPDLLFSALNGAIQIVADFPFDDPADSLAVALGQVTEDVALLGLDTDRAPPIPEPENVLDTGLEVSDLDFENGLQFAAIGEGEVSVAVEYNFIPSEIFEFPQYRGLSVNLVVQKADPQNDGGQGGPIVGVPIGSIVVLTLQVTSPDDVGPVRLEVGMPAGLEPIDPAVAPDLPQLCDFPGFFSGPFGFPWWFECPELTVTPSLVTIDFAQQNAGTKAAYIWAVAATEGEYVFPSARAFAVNQPELSGLSAARKFTVCADAASCTDLDEAIAGPPEECPGDGQCSGFGSCNSDTGSCVCFVGFGGEECGTATG